MSRSRLQSLISNIDHMTCSLSSKNSPRNTVDFEAACSVYIRFRGVNGYHQTNTILNTSHEPKSTAVLELKYRSYEMFTIIQEFTEKYRGFRGSLFSIHPLSGC